MADEARGYLIRQFETAWKLTTFHLDGLATEECLWRPAHAGLHVHQVPDGTWRADWPDHEGYDVGPPSIAWLTWHLGFWWSMVLNHSCGDGALSRENVMWPGNADDVREWLRRRQGEGGRAPGQGPPPRPRSAHRKPRAFPGTPRRCRTALG